MKQEGNILTVSEGKEIYNLSNPDVYGKRVKLGECDTANNWGERNETIVEQEEEMFLEPKSSVTTKRTSSPISANRNINRKKANWLNRSTKSLFRLIKNIFKR
jgi:hypothetical protein